MGESIISIDICELKNIRIRDEEGIVTEVPVDRIRATVPHLFPEIGQQDIRDALAKLADAIQHLSRKDVEIDVGFHVKPNSTLPKKS